MRLTTEDWNVLATRHANSFESAQLRDKLLAEGNHFCSCCKTVQPVENFIRCAKGRGGRTSRCKRCSLRQNSRRKTGFIAHGLHTSENSLRFRQDNPEAYARSQKLYAERHPERLRERDRNRVRVRVYDPAKAHDCYVKNREGILAKAAQQRIDDPNYQRAAKRKTFDKRKSIGMGGRQANYMSDATEFNDEWNAIKGVAA